MTWLDLVYGAGAFVGGALGGSLSVWITYLWSRKQRDKAWQAEMEERQREHQEHVRRLLKYLGQGDDHSS